MVKLQRISVMPLAKILLCLHAVVGLILGVIVSIGSLTNPQDEAWSLGGWAILVFPIINALLGFLTAIFLAWGYNLLAQWMGGIEFELKEQKI